MAYYPQLECVLIDANGVRTAAASKTFDVYNITTSTAEGSLVSDANGVIESGSIGSADGDVLELTHATYPGVHRFVTRATLYDAFTRQDQYGTTYIVEDLSTAGTATRALFVAVDLDNPAAVPLVLGTGRTGETTEFGIQKGSVARDYRIYPISQKLDGSIERTDYTRQTTEYTDITIPALPGGTVTSVAMTVPTFLSVSGSPITTSGTFAVSLANQTAKTFLAGPTSGGAAAPTFRAIAMADLGTGTPSSSNYLRGDGSWQTISLSPAGSNTEIQFNNSGAFGATPNVSLPNTNTLLVRKPSTGANTVAGTIILDRNDSTNWRGGAIFSYYLSGVGETLAFGVSESTTAPNTLTSTRMYLTNEAGLRFVPTIHGTTITTSGTELLLQQTGDSGGACFLLLRNRFGLNGAVFGNPAADLVDFAFQPSTTSKQQNIRYEARSGSLINSNNTNGEFQFLGTAGASFPQYFALGESCVTVNGSVKFGVGVTNPAAKAQFRSTTEQLRLEYDASNYFSTTVSSAGAVTLNAVGSSAGFIFSDAVTLNESLTIADAKDIILNTTTGTKIGTATSQKLGFFNATPVTQRSNIGAITDSTSGTAGASVDDVGGSFDQSTLNDNFATVVQRLNRTEQVLQDLGLTA